MKHMQAYSCLICGEVYLGRETPGTCPFCGVNNAYLVPAEEWTDKNKEVAVSEASKKNLEHALKIELSNTAFYLCVSKKTKSEEISRVFKGLMKVEKEHASVFQKLLGLSEVPAVTEECSEDDKASFENSSQREQKAVDFYKQALAEATEPRIKEVFGAIMLVEKDHQELDREYLSKLK